MSDYKVKDINLAEFGRKEISLAETEMPGLMALIKEYKGKNPLKGARICSILFSIPKINNFFDPLLFNFIDIPLF